MFAVIRHSGRQFKVSPNKTIKVNKFPVKGKTIELKDVLLINDGKKTLVGKPIVKGASVTAEVVKEGKDKKVIVQKYKSKTRYRKKTGHRQSIVELKISKITAPTG
ncbi:MAG: 50S ribosomal protein L21 [bacterium]